MSRAALALLAAAGLVGAPDDVVAAADPAADPAAALEHEPSSYLRAHAGDLVAWRPWGDAAFALARAQGKPVLLSIGYASCHWCHVLERESFCDAGAAAEINGHYVPILVDREALPSVDAYYSAFVAAASGSAGWPLIVLLDADRRPIAGTSYLPRARLLAALTAFDQRWAATGARLAEGSAGVVARMAAPAPPAMSDPPDAARLLRHALTALSAQYDAVDGGFGTAPKFPQPATLELLLRPEASEDDRGRCLATLDHLIGGAIHDILGGGFHRYAVDAAWRVPHFEKMLPDQALMCSLCLRSAHALHAPALMAIAREILAYCEARLQEPDGGYAAGEDADSLPLGAPGVSAPGEGAAVEGAYYRWSQAEIDAALAPMGARGAMASRLLAAVCALHPAGNVPPELDPGGGLSGCNLLRLEKPAADCAAAVGMKPTDADALFAQALGCLARARAARPAPARDEDEVVGWNGLMVRAWAQESALGTDPRALGTAVRVAKATLAAWDPARGLSHLVGSPACAGNAFDYAALISGLIALHEASGDPQWASDAVALERELERTCWDQSSSTFREGPASDALPTPPRQDDDGAAFAANSLCAANLLWLSRASGEPVYTVRLARLAESYRRLLAGDPQDMPGMVAALVAAQAPVRRVVVIGDAADPRTAALLRATWSGWHPDLVRVCMPPAGAGPFARLATLAALASARSKAPVALYGDPAAPPALASTPEALAALISLP